MARHSAPLALKPAPPARSAWWRWRHARPFWGGLLVTLAGAEILVTVKAPLPVILHVGMQNLAGYLVPMVLLLCGVLLLISPAQRLFYSLVAAGLTLASWVTSNLGGFIIGILLGLIGSALAFAWTPDKYLQEQLPASPPPGEVPPDGEQEHPDTSETPAAQENKQASLNELMDEPVTEERREQPVGQASERRPASDERPD